MPEQITLFASTISKLFVNDPIVFTDITGNMGNARGVNAVDFQSNRTAATQVASGLRAVAMGSVITASASYTVGIGYSCISASVYGVAIGKGETAGARGVSIGRSNTSGSYGVCIGASPAAMSAGAYATCVGYRCNASASKTSGVGSFCRATASGASSFGYNNNNTGTYGLCAGAENTNNSNYGIAVGRNSDVTNDQGIAIGVNNTTSGYRAGTFGSTCTASASNSWAVGKSVTNATTNSVEIGPDNTNKVRVSSAGLTILAGNAIIDTAGKGLNIKEGANARQGIATLIGGTLTVATTAVTANSRIFLTHQNNSGVVGFVTISARTAATDFTILSSNALDTSDIAWVILEPA